MSSAGLESQDIEEDVMAHGKARRVVTSAVMSGWLDCGSWCPRGTRSWGSTLPTTSR